MGCYNIEEIRALENQAIKSGINTDTLMLNAAQAVLQEIKKRFYKKSSMTIVCGGGNNAGDGYRLAEIAYKEGYKVEVIAMGDGTQLKDAALRSYEDCKKAKVPIKSYQEGMRFDHTIVVDALFGIGFTGAISDKSLCSLIKNINESEAYVIAVDVPSGVNANTGGVLGPCIKAHLTVTFIGMKCGLLTGVAPDYCGETVVHTIGLEKLHLPRSTSYCELLDTSILASLPQRKIASHKGDFGRVLVIGGEEGMPGAIRMAAEASLRAGAGTVTIATRSSHLNSILSHRPEIMGVPLENVKDLPSIASQYDVLVVGPGLNESIWSHEVWDQLLMVSKPMVIDAGALRLLSKESLTIGTYILTPHPGEAASLLGVTSLDIQHDRFQAIFSLQKKYGGSIVLKGNGSLILTSQKKLMLCPHGNSGMATAGMGDILSGTIGGLWAQGLYSDQALSIGVYVHALAGDILAKETGLRGMIATDLLPIIQKLLNGRLH